MNGSSSGMGNKAKSIFRLIRKQQKVSKQHLLEQCEIPVSTLTRILEELTAQGWIRETGLGESTGGRRPILYEVNPEYGYLFGLEISRLYARLVLCDLQTNKLAERSWSMTREATPQYVMDRAANEVESLLREGNISLSAVLGLGIGAVGPVDRERGMILQPRHFLAPGWENVEICRLLHEKLGIPVVLDNGANTAIRGEYWADSAKEFKHLLYIHGGMGLRSAVMSAGKVVYGAVDMEGAVGQMIIQTDGRPHRESGGNYGSLESYTAIHALEKEASAKLKQGRDSLLLALAGSPEQVSFAHLVRALQQQDPMTVEIFAQAATYFGIGLANLLNILHPEKVILGGPLITAHDLFFQTSTRVAVQKAYYYPEYQVIFSRGMLGEDAIALGAAIMIIDSLTEE
ncbi:ROK family protein [Paenibacillus sp. J2TS4]|uniref:ROK family protein n=1 Tax=Paenibacillus sp. J2TS4 TaxID=2807194 RepID=UPI001B274AD2|nr:ROK family protein [Paenibacillus sp. J2TS4]GIP31537.1 transcriptional regulator [Paenibacillus sp. J2TS4]